MQKQLHPKFINSSNLIFISAILGILNFTVSKTLVYNSFTLTVAIGSVLFVIGLGFLVRQGFDWVKYLLLIITILGLVGVPTFLKNLMEDTFVGIVNILQLILQIYSVVLLFQIPKDAN